MYRYDTVSARLEASSRVIETFAFAEYSVAKSGETDEDLLGEAGLIYLRVLAEAARLAAGLHHRLHLLRVDTCLSHDLLQCRHDARRHVGRGLSLGRVNQEILDFIDNMDKTGARRSDSLICGGRRHVWRLFDRVKAFWRTKTGRVTLRA